ncbi:hypothetical protein HPB49_010198 [Dermacentor silvarum]|uniref:Uncharacterized protein n=1 Tax=Dermacentor silvarum TaxID=543639 RepID=A0ACB8DYM2_DERSI|nr:hypothetical protein HPB49_010198 [Dermacentor silvarum]
MEHSAEKVNHNGGGDPDAGHDDAITARDLLQALQEKYIILAAFLEWLTLGSAAQPQPAPTFQVTPDLSQNISSFDGSDDAPAAREWIDNIRRMSTLPGWPVEYALETAKSRLLGAVKDWYRARSSQMKSWEEFEERSSRMFVS